MPRVIDQAFVEVLPKLNRFVPDLRRQLSVASKQIAVDVRKMGHDAGESYGKAYNRALGAQIRRAPRPQMPKMPGGGGGGGGAGGGASGGSFATALAGDLARTTIKLGAFASASGLAGGAVAALASGVASLAGAAGPAAGALAVYPALMLAAKQATLVAKVGLLGMEDAIKGDAKAMAKLAPSARQFVSTLKDLAPAADRVRRSVQGELFQNLAGPLRQLAGNYLPIFRAEMVQTAGALNFTARQAAQLANTPAFQADFATVMAGNTNSIADLGQAGVFLADTARHLLVVVQPLVARFTGWAVGAAQVARDSVAAGRASGQLAAFFQRAGDTAAHLGRIAANLGVGLFSVFRIGAGAGKDLLDTIESAAARFREWTTTVAGQNSIAKFFADGNAALLEFGRLLRDAGGLFGDSFPTASLTPVIEQIRTQLLPAVAQLFDNMSVETALPGIVTAVADLTETLSAGGGAALSAFATALGAIATSALFIVQTVPGASLALAGLATVAGVSTAAKITGLTAAVKALTATTLAHTAATLVSTSTLGTWIGVKYLEAAAWARSALAATASAVATWAATAATWAAAAAARALSFAMAVLTSPITLVVLAIAALVAGLVYAYKNSETFKRIVDGAFRAVGAAAKWLWESAIKPAFSAIGAAAVWLWNNAIVPAFNGIKAAVGAVFTAIKWVWDNVLKPVFTAIWWTVKNVVWPILQTAFAAILFVVKAAFAGIKWYWANVVAPVFKALGAAAMWVWRSVIVPAFNGIKWVVGKAFQGIKWYWDNVVRPVFNAIAFAARWLWNNVIVPAFNGIKSAVGKAFDGIRWVWNNTLKPTFEFLRKAVSKIPGWFNSAKDGIGKAWNKIKDLAKAPIRFVIQTVLNDGLIRAFNWVAGKIPGGKKITPIPVPFHRGGIYPGYTPGRDIGTIGVSGGEAVMRPEWTRAVGPRRINRWNQLARAGGVGAVAQDMGGYFLGGVVGKITSGGRAAAGAVRSVGSRIKNFGVGALREAFTHVTDPVFGLLNGIRGNALGDLAAAAPLALRAKVMGWLGEQDAAGAGGGAVPWTGGGSPFQRVSWRGHQFNARTAAMLSAAERMLRTTLHITQGSFSRRVAASGSTHAGGGAVDISSPTSLAVQAALRRVGFAAWIRTPSQGPWGRHIHGIAIGDPTASPAAQGQVASFRRGGDGLRGMFRGGIFSYDRGGYLPPGLTLAYNGTGRPERVVGPGGGGDTHYHFHMDGAIVANRQDALEWLTGAVETLKRRGRMP